MPKSFFSTEHDIEDNNTLVFEDMYGGWHDIRESRYALKTGEIVAVAQSYRDLIPNPISIPADMGWFNKMFVRANQMPHQIRITNVRVEKLQDISDEDCIKEGIRDYSTPAERRYGFSDFKVETIVAFRSPREAYAALIDRISGKGTWDSNPFVFVYEFELVK